MTDEVKSEEAPLGNVEDQLASWITKQSNDASQAAETGAPVARRGRRVRSFLESEKPVYKPVAVEALKKLTEVLGRYIAARNGDKWLPTTTEAQAFSEAADKVVVKYLPMISLYAEEAALALVIVAYLVPRLEFANATKEENTEVSHGVKQSTDSPFETHLGQQQD
jgi:hypothetical protein